MSFHYKALLLITMVLKTGSLHFRTSNFSSSLPRPGRKWAARPTANSLRRKRIQFTPPARKNRTRDFTPPKAQEFYRILSALSLTKPMAPEKIEKPSPARERDSKVLSEASGGFRVQQGACNL